jgi:hypothetical protein
MHRNFLVQKGKEENMLAEGHRHSQRGSVNRSVVSDSAAPIAQSKSSGTLLDYEAH